MLARDGGSDGLALYRVSCRDLPALIAPRGIARARSRRPSNARALEDLVRAALPHAGVETVQDYAGLDRLVIARSRPRDRASGGYGPTYAARSQG